MDKFLELKRMYIEKKNKNECNDKQKEFLDVFLEDEYCFLKIKEKDALSIIWFLGVPKENVYKYYKEILLSMIKKKENSRNE